MKDRYAHLRHGGGGPTSQFVCGAVQFDHPAARHLVAALPPVLHVRSAATQSEWMSATLRLLATEAASLRPGGEAIITRLCDILADVRSLVL